MPHVFIAQNFLFLFSSTTNKNLNQLKHLFSLQQLFYFP